jgi:hypothetical protein
MFSVNVSAAGTSMESAECISYDNIKVSGSFSEDNQQYWYKFTTSNQEAWTQISLNKDAIEYFDLNVYDINGSELNPDDEEINNQNSFIYKLSQDSLYYICIDNYKMDKREKFEISLNQIVDDVPDTMENSISINSNDQFTCKLENKNDIDYFKLQSSVFNSWNQIKLVNNGTSDLDIIFYDSGGEIIDDTIVKSNSSAYLNNKMKLDTMYYISVSCNFFGDNNVGNYQISYNEIIDDVGDNKGDSKTIKVNKSYKQKIEVTDDVDYYKLKAKSTTYSLYFKNESNEKLYICLEKNHVPIIDSYVTGHKSINETIYLEKNNLCYIYVHGDATAKYTIKLTNQ